MKNFILSLFCVFCINTFAQRGFFEETNIMGSSNFIGKKNGAMHEYGLEFMLGYQFNEKFRLGVRIPLTHIIFRENNERFSSVGNALFGLSLNVRLFKKEDFSLRTDISSFVVDTRKRQEGLGDSQNWFFLKSSAGLQFHGSIDDYDSVYIGVGVNYHTDTHTYSPTFSKNYHFFAPYISIGFTNFLSKKK